MTRRTIPCGRQSIDDEDIAAVAHVLRSDWLTQGPAAPTVAAARGKRFGAAHVVAVNSAMRAPHLACLGPRLSQMRKLEAFAEKRRALAACRDRLLSGLPVLRPWQHPDGQTSWHLYIVRLSGILGSAGRYEAFTQTRDPDIGVNLHYIPTHMKPDHRERRAPKAPPLLHTERDDAKTIRLPLYRDLEEDEHDWRVACLSRAMAGSHSSEALVGSVRPEVVPDWTPFGRQQLRPAPRSGL